MIGPLLREKSVDRCMKTDKTRAGHFLVRRFQHNWDDMNSLASVIGKTHGPAANEAHFNLCCSFSTLYITYDIAILNVNIIYSQSSNARNVMTW